MPTTVEVEAFKYSELSDEAKQHARDATGWDEHYRDVAVDYMQHDAWDVLGTLTTWELTYLIGFCQGSGVGLKGWIDATDIPDPEWVGTILPMFGASKTRATISGHDVEWPRPFRDARIDFDNERGKPFFLPGDIEVTFVTGKDTDDGYSDDVVVNRYIAEEDADGDAIAIWQAMGSYFEKFCDKLYSNVCAAILEGDDEGMEQDCEERQLLFNDRGERVAEEGRPL